MSFRTTGKVLCLAAAAAMIMRSRCVQIPHIQRVGAACFSGPAAVPGRGDSVTVFARISDDENPGLRRSAWPKRGSKARKPHVVLVTNGDGFKFAAMRALKTVRLTPTEVISFAYARQKETLSALRTLGIPESRRSLSSDTRIKARPECGTRIGQNYPLHFSSPLCIQSQPLFQPHLRATRPNCG